MLDEFSLQKINYDDVDPMQWDKVDDAPKIIKSAQFSCVPSHSGLAVAMHNYWVYCYDIASNKKI